MVKPDPRYKDLREKRVLIEQGVIDPDHTGGRGSYHLRSLFGMRSMLKLFLRLTGLQKGGEANARYPVRVDMDFYFPDLPPAFDGFRILHISDLHVDCLPGFAEDLKRNLMDVEADVCLMTGDYRFEVSGPLDQVYQNMPVFLDHIRLEHGTIGILGNHDYLEEAEAIAAMGPRMLVNESMEISREGESIHIIGLDDAHYYGCDDLPGVVEKLPDNAFKILMVHSPEIYKDAAEVGCHLYLCGHTHAGQIHLPVMGPLLLNANCPRHYCFGSWKYKAMQGYTSAGIGSSMVPVRLLCPPEYAVITLRRGTGPG